MKKKARSPILKGFGKLSCAVWKFTGQQYKTINRLIASQMPLGDYLILPISVLFGTEDRITCQELYNISKDRLQDTYSSESFSSMS